MNRRMVAAFCLGLSVGLVSWTIVDGISGSTASDSTRNSQSNGKLSDYEFAVAAAHNARVHRHCAVLSEREFKLAAYPTDESISELPGSLPEQIESTYSEYRRNLARLKPPRNMRAAHQQLFDAVTALTDGSGDPVAETKAIHKWEQATGNDSIRLSPVKRMCSMG